jgi:hypothetical protein
VVSQNVGNRKLWQDCAMSESITAPSELQHETVDEIKEYQTNRADWSILFDAKWQVQDYRYYYLKNLRWDWEYVESCLTGKPFILLKGR